MSVIITNKDFQKVVFWKKTVVLGSHIKGDLVQVNFYRRTRLINCSTRLTSRGTLSTCLLTRSTGLSTRSTVCYF